MIKAADDLFRVKPGNRRKRVRLFSAFCASHINPEGQVRYDHGSECLESSPVTIRSPLPKCVSTGMSWPSEWSLFVGKVTLDREVLPGLLCFPCILRPKLGWCV